MENTIEKNDSTYEKRDPKLPSLPSKTKHFKMQPIQTTLEVNSKHQVLPTNGPTDKTQGGST